MWEEDIGNVACEYKIYKIQQVYFNDFFYS